MTINQVSEKNEKRSVKRKLNTEADSKNFSLLKRLKREKKCSRKRLNSR